MYVPATPFSYLYFSSKFWKFIEKKLRYTLWKMVVTMTVKRQVILPSFVHNFQMNKSRNVIKASGARIWGSWTKIGASGSKVGAFGAKIGGSGADIGGSVTKSDTSGIKIGAFKARIGGFKAKIVGSEAKIVGSETGIGGSKVQDPKRHSTVNLL